MLPQNGHQNRNIPQQQQQPQFSQNLSGLPVDNSSHFNLEPSIAKQMAALNAANLSRIATSRSAGPSSAGATTSGSYLGGISSINQSIGPAAPDIFNATAGLGSMPFQAQNIHQQQQATNANLTHPSSFLDSSMSQSNGAVRAPLPASSLKQRQRSFLTGLSNVMASRKEPLPPALTGIQYPPNYDESKSPWKNLEISTTEVGAFRLAGKDIDLLRLWGLVYQAGGGAKLMQQGGWSAILPHFELPDQLPVPMPNGTTSTASVLAQYYKALLGPFEDAYKRNAVDQQRRAFAAAAQRPPGAQAPQAPQPSNAARFPHAESSSASLQTNFAGQVQHIGGPGVSGIAEQPMNGAPGAHNSESLNGVSSVSRSSSAHPPPTPRTSVPSAVQPNQPTPRNLPQVPSSESSGPNIAQFPDNNILDSDAHGIKRKMDSEEADGKRVRQKTGGSEPDSQESSATPAGEKGSMPPNGPSNPSILTSQATTTSGQSRPRPPSRRKIEYIPLAREIDTFGGRDLNAIEDESARGSQRRPLRDISDWGNVDIEALTMSIRSRLSAELSYALTTFTLLSTMRGQTPGSGFPIFQCSDLLDELLDLLEDEAFDGVDDVTDTQIAENSRLPTHRELVNIVYEEESEPFAGLEYRQGLKGLDSGPRQRSGNVILTVMNVLRNLSVIDDNRIYMAQHERLLDLLFRICCLATPVDGPPKPAAQSLSLSDLLSIRRDTLLILLNIGNLIHFRPSSSSPKAGLRMAARAFELAASCLVDPAEAVSPSACVRLFSTTVGGYPKPPSLADLAVDVFARLSQPDSNRQVFSKAAPQSWIWLLFEALVHRLPVIDADYQVLGREPWLSHLEKILLAMYSLAFLAPPELKNKVKTNRRLGFPKVLLRMVQKFLTGSGQEGRIWFSICARRAIEAMKVIDDAEDSFDTSQSTVPTMSFGMGYGDVGDSGIERGTGLLGGYRDITCDMLLQNPMDPITFSELDSLARVE